MGCELWAVELAGWVEVSAPHERQANSNSRERERVTLLKPVWAHGEPLPTTLRQITHTLEVHTRNLRHGHFPPTSSLNH